MITLFKTLTEAILVSLDSAVTGTLAPASVAVAVTVAVSAVLMRTIDLSKESVAN